MKNSRTVALILSASFLLSISESANAYIDSGTGSLFLQAAVSGLLGALFVIHSGWANIKSLLSRKRSEEIRRDA
jgi:hypothetical protein